MGGLTFTEEYTVPCISLWTVRPTGVGRILSTVKTHAAPIRCRSSKTSVAKVSSAGKITAVSNGTCYIYVYTVNGAYRKVKVAVK